MGKTETEPDNTAREEQVTVILRMPAATRDALAERSQASERSVAGTMRLLAQKYLDGEVHL